MEQDLKLRNLKLFLKVWGIATILVMSINWSAFIFQIEAFNPGHSMHWLIWDNIHGHVGPMIFIIYIIWGIYFLIAAKDPVKHISFLKFTMWANLGHGLVMIPMALTDSSYHSKFLTDIPFIILIAVAIYVWMPDNNTQKQLA
ncbi:MAG TPA: DUF6632 domain-containing protein [Chitinophagaceae bacterium]|jgi:hypothetical protein|nr:DUF6632 domain-containing protein [Chitinophagaceae bacterium]